MVVFVRRIGVSTIKCILQFPSFQKIIFKRQMGEHGPEIFRVTPSRWQFVKMRDFVHFYGCVGLIIALPIVFICDVFVGPAELAEIPPDYTPKYHEYFRHPISRFFAQHIVESHQQSYEKMLHMLHEEQERALLREIEQKVKNKMRERNDYKAYYYRPVFGKYLRASRDAANELEQLRGDV